MGTKLQEYAKRLEEAQHALDERQRQLLLAERLASLGQLSAGIAHEINNPISYVSSNFFTLSEYAGALLAALERYQAFCASAEPFLPPILRDSTREIAMFTEYVNLPHVRDDLPHLLEETREGLDRVKTIVRRLKTFSRSDEAPLKRVDLNDVIDGALAMVGNELKYRCTVRRETEELPAVACHPGQIEQVFVNLLINACHAIPDEGVITISSRVEDDRVVVTVADTGEGISPEHLERIFSPFFSTKPAGRGTGLGLSISHDIVRSHGGTIGVKSAPGEGTTFSVSLPAAGRLSEIEAPSPRHEYPQGAMQL